MKGVSSSPWVCWVACGPGLPDRLSVLGVSSTWMLRAFTDTYSFSSGPLSGPVSKLLL